MTVITKNGRSEVELLYRRRSRWEWALFYTCDEPIWFCMQVPITNGTLNKGPGTMWFGERITIVRIGLIVFRLQGVGYVKI